MSLSSAHLAVSSLPEPLTERFRELEEKVREWRPHEDLAPLRAAFEYAAGHHASQTRKSGEPYVAHPLEVAHLLAGMRLDLASILTGLLHDVVEDTSASLEEIEKLFGKEVARCVDGVTKLGRLDYHSAEDRQAQNFRKMLLAMVGDIRVMLVKLADRLHNMRTLSPLKPEKQEQIARETLEIYAPIALRLGMGKVRGELEDLAFSYLEPDAYREIVSQIDARREATGEFLARLKDELSELMQKADIPCRIEGRVKRAYSIYRKLQRQLIRFDQVYDLLALRVITDSVKNCYAALGVIHSHWRPIPGRIRDFIGMPRSNLYQSLHTSVMTDRGEKFEVQIRTEEMHSIAEEGICAHWKYKEGVRGADENDSRLSWVRQLVELHQEVEDPDDFLLSLKVDLYPEEVYVFTPKGKLIVLPRGGTSIDFAYAIHTEVGHTCIGAKVNGRIVPLDEPLNNGDTVEIITQQGHTPSQDWLAVVQTSRARSKIKQWLNTSRRQRAQEIGQKLLQREARRLKLSLKKTPRELIGKVCQEYGCSQLSDLYVALGYGKFSPRQVAMKLIPGLEPSAPPSPPVRRTVEVDGKGGAPRDVLTVKGVGDVLVYRANCCNPIPGEPIVGYVTRGKGVAVHSRRCRNVQNLLYESERRIDVEWGRGDQARYRARLQLSVEDRPGILNELTSILSAEGVNIASVDAREHPATRMLASVEMIVEVGDVKQLDRILTGMRRVAGVREAFRTPGG